MSGKGDDPRPLSVPQEQFNANWDAIDWTRRAREQQMRDALTTGTGVLTVEPGARVPSNIVNAVPAADLAED